MDHSFGIDEYDALGVGGCVNYPHDEVRVEPCCLVESNTVFRQVSQEVDSFCFKVGVVGFIVDEVLEGGNKLFFSIIESGGSYGEFFCVFVRFCK